MQPSESKFAASPNLQRVQISELQGIPYTPGGTNPDTGLDCYGLALYTYAKCGYRLTLNRTSDRLEDMQAIAQTLPTVEPSHLALIVAPGIGQAGALITLVNEADRLWAVWMDAGRARSAIAPWIQIRRGLAAIACVSPPKIVLGGGNALQHKG